MHDLEFEQQLRSAIDGLPGPTGERTATARRWALSALGEPAPNRPPRGRRRGAVVAVALVLTFGGLGGFALGRTSAPDRRTKTVAAPLSATGGPGFLPASGWNSAQTGADVSPPQAGSAAAATVDLLDPPGAEPHATLATLSPRDVMVQASILSPADFARGPGYEGVRANYPPRTLPLRVEDGLLQGGWEGEPDRWRYVIPARVAGWLLDVNVYVGTAHPSVDVRRRADEQLARLLLPSPCPSAQPLSATQLRDAAAIVERMLPRGVDRQVTTRRATDADPIAVRCDSVPRARIAVVEARFPHASHRDRTYLVSRQGGRYVVWSRVR